MGCHKDKARLFSLHSGAIELSGVIALFGIIFGDKHRNLTANFRVSLAVHGRRDFFVHGQCSDYSLSREIGPGRVVN